jgi:hypothetical protein
MITRGCIGNYLKLHHLINESIPIGPVPRQMLCDSVVKKVKNNNLFDSYENKECISEIVEKNNCTDLLLKNYFYQEDKVGEFTSFEKLTSELLKHFEYLCSSSAELEEIFTQKFPSSFPGYEKETNRYCLFKLLSNNSIIESDFDVNFEGNESTPVRCPEYIHEGILAVKSEGFDLLRESPFYVDEEIWECAASERMNIGYVKAYYRLMAYTMLRESEEKYEREKKRFIQVLHNADEKAIECFKKAFESL